VARSRAKRTAARSLDARLCTIDPTRLAARKPHRPARALSLRDNGTRLERTNWLGNTELRAIQKSFGVTVNYLYGHYGIENNHEAFVRDSTTVRSPDVDVLM
jgi:Malonyl-CoA decarboxylase C-terminal domain